MGIVIRQSIKGSIWSYLGVAFGFVTTSYLYPRYLTTDVVGLFGLLISWSALFASITALGFPGVTSRLFPYFRNNEKGHNGYLFLVFVLILIGSVLFIGLFYLIRPWLIGSNLEKSFLFTEYVNLLIPLSLFTLLFTQLDTFVTVLYDGVYGIFAKEFVQRFLILLVTVIFIYGIIDLHQMILGFTIAVCIKGVMMIYYLINRGEFYLKPKLTFISRKMRQEMVSVGTFNILAGISNTLVFNIDKIIINQIMGLSATGVYTVAFYFGVLVVIPSRPLLRISGTLIADAFRRKDMDYIEDIYRRSALNQFIIGGFLFGGIVINIENILAVLGPDYSNGRWVIVLIGFGYLVDMITGANATIIAYSKHFRMILYFMLILLLMVVVNLIIFVPIWGITGAALAISLAIVFNNIMRFAYLKYRFGMQPFSISTVKVAGILLISSCLCMVIPVAPLIPDLLIRSVLFALIFGGMILYFRVSEDINKMVNSVWNKRKF